MKNVFYQGKKKEKKVSEVQGAGQKRWTRKTNKNQEEWATTDSRRAVLFPKKNTIKTAVNFAARKQ